MIATCPHNGILHASPRCCRGRLIRARASSSDQPFDARTRRALHEAAEILAEAQELAQQQTIQELRSSWQADSLNSPTVTAGQATEAALAACFVEFGLSNAAAGTLLHAIKSDPQLSSSHLSTELLSQKLSSLQRVLPDAEVAALVAAEPLLLLASSNQLVSNLVSLVNALPGRDVISMVVRRPKLLLVNDMPDRLVRITNKLVSLHPSHSHHVIAGKGILEENPELLLRMDYYLSDNIRLIDELPIEIQNMMVLGDESGVGFLYRYWRDKQAEQRQQQQPATGLDFGSLA
eukprot:gene6197-6433_t